MHRRKESDIFILCLILTLGKASSQQNGKNTFIAWPKSLSWKTSEAATETIFENIFSFLPGEPFSGFFQMGLCIHRTHTYFPRRNIGSSNRYKLPRKIYLFIEHKLISRSTFLAIEQIPIFQEAFFKYQWIETGNFQEGTPPNRYLTIGLGGFFRILDAINYFWIIQRNQIVYFIILELKFEDIFFLFSNKVWKSFLNKFSKLRINIFHCMGNETKK